MHAMRTRIIESPSFEGDDIFGAILFEDTMDREIDGRNSVAYLWNMKHVVPFLKVDKGLASEQAGVHTMKPIEGLTPLLSRAKELGVFGTKMRSFIKHADPVGIDAVVDQQFDYAEQILTAGLVPIIEPEVDITSAERTEAEELLRERISDRLRQLGREQLVILKLSLPVVDDYYGGFVRHPNVMRVLALSGGYSRADAVRLLAANHGVVASFSRALTEGLSIHQSDEEFDATLRTSIEVIRAASLT